MNSLENRKAKVVIVYQLFSANWLMLSPEPNVCVGIYKKRLVFFSKIGLSYSVECHLSANDAI